MSMKVNYIVKVIDARIGDIKKALESGGIKVSSIIEIYKEEVKEAEVGSSQGEI